MPQEIVKPITKTIQSVLQTSMEKSLSFIILTFVSMVIETTEYKDL